MSSLWRRIRSQSDEKLGKYMKNETEIQIKKSNTFTEGLTYVESTLIKSSDEDLFLNEQHDNIIKKYMKLSSQLSRDLQGILCNEKSCCYFVDFLSQHNEEKNIFFLKDCLVFEDSANKSAGEKIIEKIDKYPISDDECPGEKLPDLVCNIPQSAISSPLPSPEEEINPTDSDSTCKTWDVVFKDYIHTDTFKNISINKTEKLVSQLASNIVKSYIEPGLTHLLMLNTEVISSILNEVSSGTINKDLFSAAKQEVMCLLNNRFLPQFLESEYFLRHQVEIFTSEALTLQDILQCDITLLYFMQFMEQENAHILLKFWLAVSSFKNQFNNSAGLEGLEQLQSDAMILYDKYFSMQATCPLGFSHQVRCVVEGNICKEVGPDCFCFDLPLCIALHVIERDYFKHYISSSIHIKCLDEMINSVSVASKTHRRSGSTVSSENSQSTNKCTNTLLAMDTSHRGLANLGNTHNPITIDSRHLFDPDSLWRRKNFRKLSCGYIDKMGRFEAEISPEPGREQSKLTKKFKKFIKYEEGKIKEEMAYKVAEMIIKDVTNVTLSAEVNRNINTAS